MGMIIQRHKGGVPSPLPFPCLSNNFFGSWDVILFVGVVCVCSFKFQLDLFETSPPWNDLLSEPAL
jgi:hypothetical protein